MILRPVVPRATGKATTRDRTLEAIRDHGNGYSAATAALRSAAERNFGSWAQACIAAGIDPPKRGRPSTRVVTDEEAVRERYRMRRWWLDRYTLDEIRELAECLR